VLTESNGGPARRAFLKQQSASPTVDKRRGSSLVSQLNRTSSVQIALRLPAPDVAQAREIADRKGIGYQTLLKMLVHEGLQERPGENSRCCRGIVYQDHTEYTEACFNATSGQAYPWLPCCSC
jgi:predicted DNA binding CopG/RHH family protein